MGWLACLCGLWRHENDPETAPLFPPPTTVLTAPPRAHPKPIATLFSLFPSSPRPAPEPPITELSTTATAAPTILAYTFPASNFFDAARKSEDEARAEADERRRSTISRAYGSRMCLIGAPSPPATPTVLPSADEPHPWFHARPEKPPHRRLRSLDLSPQLAMSVSEHGLPGTLAPIVAAARARRANLEDVTTIVITPETPVESEQAQVRVKVLPRHRPPPLPLRPHASTVQLCDSPIESTTTTPTASVSDSLSLLRGRTGGSKRLNLSADDDSLGVVYKDLGLKGLPSLFGARQPRRATSKSRLRAKRARADTVA